MGAAEKDKKAPLSQIVADLLLRSKRGERPSFNINHLREEIKKEIASHDEIFGKFLGLLESFQDIIPEEKQRYQAALKALLCTSGLSQKDILKATDNQLTELKRLEKGVLSALSNWHDELKATESRLQDIRNEISRLRKKITQLEREEQEILNDKVSREEERKLSERGVENVLADIAAEITDLREKIEEFTPGRVLSQPLTSSDLIKDYESAIEKSGSDRKSNLRKVSDLQEIEGEKKCPMCGHQVKWYSREKMWKCFVCAYEAAEDMDIPVL